MNYVEIVVLGIALADVMKAVAQDVMIVVALYVVVAVEHALEVARGAALVVQVIVRDVLGDVQVVSLVPDVLVVLEAAEEDVILVVIQDVKIPVLALVKRHVFQLVPDKATQVLRYKK